MMLLISRFNVVPPPSSLSDSHPALRPFVKLAPSAVTSSLSPSVFSPSNAWDSVLVENLFDLRTAAFEEVFELLAERVVAAPKAHRDVEDEGQERQINLRRDGHNRERHALAPREVARQRPPRDGHINVAARDRVNDSRGRVRLRVVAVDRVAAHVLDDAARG